MESGAVSGTEEGGGVASGDAGHLKISDFLMAQWLARLTIVQETRDRFPFASLFNMFYFCVSGGERGGGKRERARERERERETSERPVI